MTHAVIQQLLDGIEQRERELAGQTGELAARMREADAEREALATMFKTVRAMAADLDLEQPPVSVLPDGAAYQQIMGVFAATRRPRPVPGPRPPGLAEARRRHPGEAQTAGQPGIP